MKNFHWLIAGVGRSGTTAIYEAVMRLAAAQGASFEGRYEPYLWGPPVWGNPSADKGERFHSTYSMHSEGIATHLTTRLFLEAGESPTHRTFVRSIFPDDISIVAKIIRGNGRLDDYLDLIPDLKIILLTRNPADTINSFIPRFSPFGSEFYKSDEARLHKELKERGRPPAQPKSIVERYLIWWESMTKAGFKCAEQNPGRVSVVPYEAFKKSPFEVFDRIQGFLAPEEFVSEPNFERQVGPTTPEVYLDSKGYAEVQSASEEYFHKIKEQSAYSDLIDVNIELSKVEKKYCQANEPHSYTFICEPHLTPLAVRRELSRAMSALDSAEAKIQEYKGDIQALKFSLDKVNKSIIDYESKIKYRKSAIDSFNYNYRSEVEDYENDE